MIFRVLNVLRHWVESHYYDFDRDPELLSRLKEFVGSVTAKNMQKWVVSIHRALKKVTVTTNNTYMFYMYVHVYACEIYIFIDAFQYRKRMSKDPRLPGLSCSTPPRNQWNGT